jgi:NADH-quinone oxidoreductase subunit M
MRLNFNKSILPLGLCFFAGFSFTSLFLEIFSYLDFNPYYGLFPVNILSLICLLPLLGCFIILLVWSQGKGSDLLFKMIAFSTSALSLISVSFLVMAFDKQATGFQFLYSAVDLPIFNLSVVLGLDGLGLVFAALTAFLIPLCILGFWNSKLFSKEFCISFLVLESLLYLAFFSVDLFFFYIFFESVLIPMFIMISVWGTRSRKIRASYMLFFFTLVGSIIMLLAMLKLYIECGTLDIRALKLIIFEENFQCMLWWPFFLAFSVKIPVFPFHVWLPEAHVEAPTGGSVLLAGVLLKLGVFGFLRFLIPMFPLASAYFSPIVFVLCSFGVVFGSLIAIRQSDLKRVIAYSSVAHMNLIVMGIFSLTFQGFEGVIIQSLAHGFVSSALFFCIGMLYERFHTRTISHISGLTVLMPVFNMFFLMFTMSNIAVPGTSSFIGELLILLSLFKSNIIACVIACTGMVLGGCYSLFLYNRLAFGIPTSNLFYGKTLNKLDITLREVFILGCLAVGNLSLGILPFLYTEYINTCCAELVISCCR